MKIALLLTLLPAVSHAEQATFHDLFSQSHLGTYAAQGDCAAPEIYVTITANSAEFSENSCIISDITRPQTGGATLYLTDCRSEGTAVGDLTLLFSAHADGSYRLDWFGDLPLYRCDAG